MAEKTPISVRAEAVIDTERKKRDRAFVKAALIEALADPRIRRNKIPANLIKIYDLLHKSSVPQQYAEIRAAEERVRMVGNRTPYDIGFLGALEDSTELENDSFVLRTASTKNKDCLTRELARTIADQIRLEHGLITGNSDMLAGRRKGFTWVLGHIGKELPERYPKYTPNVI